MRIEYRNRHSDFLNQYRRNIFNGGVYHANKLKFAQAYEFFDMYIDCAHKPLFSKFRYDSLDVRMPVAAYWAVLCGYKSQDAAKTLKHSQLHDSVRLLHVSARLLHDPARLLSNPERAYELDHFVIDVQRHVVFNSFKCLMLG